MAGRQESPGWVRRAVVFGLALTLLGCGTDNDAAESVTAPVPASVEDPGTSAAPVDVSSFGCQSLDHEAVAATLGEIDRFDAPANQLNIGGDTDYVARGCSYWLVDGRRADVLIYDDTDVIQSYREKWSRGVSEPVHQLDRMGISAFEISSTSGYGVEADVGGVLLQVSASVFSDEPLTEDEVIGLVGIAVEALE